jgi:ribosomal protein S18 acetylase RimI-like enzyme
MAYAQIDICEVGPPEYPLINVLRDTIFKEFGHVYRTPFEDMVRDRQDLICLIAHLEGNPVGYKVGYRDRPGGYYSYSGGVLPDYRGEGVAKRLQDWQHAAIRARGYKTVYFTSFNKFRSMLLFGLSTGFLPKGIDHRPEGEISIRFEKDLTKPEPDAPPALPRAAAHVESVGPTFNGTLARLCTQTGRPLDESDVDRDFPVPDAVNLLAMVENRPAGVLVAAPTKDASVFSLRHAGVLESHRRTGIGSALVDHLLGALKGRGVRTVRAKVRHENAAGLSMCLKNGFEVVGMLHDPGARATSVVLEHAVGS